MRTYEMLADGVYSAWFRTPNSEGTGIAQQAAGVSFELTLMPCREDQPPTAERIYQAATFNDKKLPKVPSR
jgi:hypothetical protein